MIRKIITHKYFKGSIYLNLPSFIMAALALITLPIILRSLNIADYGRWQYVLALQAWFLAITASNITIGAKRAIVQGQDGTFIFAFLKRWRLLILSSLLCVLTALVFRIFIRDETISYLLFITAFYLSLIYLFQTSFAEYQIAKSRFKDWGIWQIIIGAMPLIFSTYIVFITKNVFFYSISYFGLTAILSWMAWLVIIKKNKLIEEYKKGKTDTSCYSFGIKLIPVDIIYAVSAKISSILIGPIMGFANLAVFSVANNLRDQATGLIKNIPPLLYADFVNLDRDQLKKTLNKYLLKIFAVGLVITVFLLIAGWFYIKFFIPPQFDKALIYFAILSVSLLVHLPIAILDTVLNAQLRHKELLVVGIIPSIIKILLIIIFGCFWKIIGVCVAISSNYFIMFIFYYILVLREDLIGKILNTFPFLKKISGRLIINANKSR